MNAFFKALICLFFWASSAISHNQLFAAEVSGLYQGNVTVADQSSRTRNRAIPSALREVLVKISGDSAVMNITALRGVTNKARDYMLQYSYKAVDQQIVLQISFDEAKVNALLQQAGVPLWGSRRPSILIWMAVEQEDGEKQFISAETGDIGQFISQSAAKRGVPIQLPLYDLDDLQGVAMYDLWGRFTTPIEQASLRYGQPLIASVRLQKTKRNDAERIVPDGIQVDRFGEDWQIDWQFKQNERWHEKSMIGEDPEQLVTTVVNWLADQVAADYLTNLSKSGEEIIIRFLNIDNMQSFVAAERMLNSIAMIKRAQLSRYMTGQAEFSLKIAGSLDDLLKVFELEKQIQRQLDPFGLPVEELNFYWLNR